MPAQDASYYAYAADLDRPTRCSSRRSCAAPSCGCVSPCDSYYGDEELEDCGGGRGGCPGCDGCEVSRQTYRIRRARVAHRTTAGQTIAPGDFYGETSVRIYQRGGPVLQRRRVLDAMTPAGHAAWLAAGAPRVVGGGMFTRFTRG